MSLEKRCPDKGDLSLAEVNTHLDALNSATDRKEKEKILQSMLRRTTALEQKWIVRIILKGLLSPFLPTSKILPSHNISRAQDGLI